MKMLSKMDGAVDEEYDPYAEGNFIRTVSPSLNYIFSKSPGFPFGEFMLLWGPPKSGKSIISNAMVGGLHKQDPEAWAIRFDTEMRSVGKEEYYWGIDQSRFKAFNVNEPELIFDRIKNDFLPMIQNGFPLKLIIIDSLQGIQGVKAGNAKSVTDHQMGDHAMTIQKGLQAIMPVLRRNGIALISTAHIRGNLDAGMYGPKEKMAGGYAQKHTYEYFVKVTRNNNTADNNDFVDKEIKDFKGKAERHAHKIYVQMSESSRGIAGRTGQITFDYANGIVNIEEELMELAKNLNLVERPNNRTYIVGENKYNSADEFKQAIANDLELQNKLIAQVEEHVKTQGRKKAKDAEDLRVTKV